jgi:cell division inhibitor SulA
MKIDLDGRARAVISNLLRDRSQQCRMQAAEVKSESLKAEWVDDAGYTEELALIVDAGEVDKEPTSRVDRTRDLKQTDPPTRSN